MGDQKDPELTSSQKHNKITATCRTTTHETDGTYKKRPSTTKDIKKKRGVVLQYKSEETSLLKGTQKISHALGPRAKAVIGQEPGPDLPAGLGGCPGKVGGGCGSPWGRRHWWQQYLETFYSMNTAAGGCHLDSLAPRPGHTQQPVGTSAGMSQAKQLTGQGQSPMHQQTSCLKTSSTHSHIQTASKMAHPSYTNQWVDTGPSLQVAFTSLQTSLTHQGANTGCKKLQSAACGPSLPQQAIDPTLGPAGHWPYPLAGQRKLRDTPDPIPNCGRNHTPPPPPQKKTCERSSRIPGLQEPALPASNQALTSGPGFT